MEIINGLPVRYVTGKLLDGNIEQFYVGCESTCDILQYLPQDTVDLFDSKVRYYVPDMLIESCTNTEIIRYIDFYVDQDYFKI